MERENGKWSEYEGDAVCATEEVSCEPLNKLTGLVVITACQLPPALGSFACTSYTAQSNLV